MRSPPPTRNGADNRSPTAQPRFHSTVAEHKLRRFNSLILLFRLASFSFSLTSSIFMLTNTRGSDSPRWYHYDTFRFVLAANAIVAVYSLFELGASVWEISRGSTLFPEVLQVWFDFGHDQVRNKFSSYYV
ncbi:hypothetical protein Lal_00000088 [Lupinus albus]|nr:hypothetical protein Lal_00000088 [Lupinus albus]